MAQTKTLTVKSNAQPVAIDGRRGLPVYEENPFMTMSIETKKARWTVAAGTKLTDSETGEETFETTVAQVHWVDDEQFVKLFPAQVRLMVNMSAQGFRLFCIALHAIQKAIGIDRIYMTHKIAEKQAKEMGQTLSRSSYDRGVRDLCEKGVIALTDDPGWFFINPALLFNGDRARFVTEFRKKPKPQQLPTPSLPLPGFEQETADA